MDDIRHTIHAYILNEFLPGEDPDELTVDTALITGGVLDSISTALVCAAPLAGASAGGGGCAFFLWKPPKPPRFPTLEATPPKLPM